MGTVTVVTSGKGGAGKSTVTAGLGCALAGLGQRVLLVDGDAGLRSLDLMLGIGDGARYDLSDVFSGNCEPIRAMYPSPICEGVSVLPAPTGLEQLCRPTEMRKLCRGLARYYDQVLIDCPAGVGAGFLTAVAGADQAIVVTTPDMVCARDAQIVGGLLSARRLESRLVINRLRPRWVRRGRLPDVDAVMDTAGIRLLGLVPEDELLATSCACGRPIPAHCAASQCFSRIARRMCGEDVELAQLEKLVDA